MWEQENCPLDNYSPGKLSLGQLPPQDNCPPKIASPEIVPEIISPWTTGAQILPHRIILTTECTPK